MRRIELIIVIFFSIELFDCFIASIYCTDEESPADDFMPKNRSHYTDDDRAKIIRIFQETHTGEKGHEKRIKERWNELNAREMPQAGHILYKQAVRWIKKGYAEKLLTEQERQSLNPLIIQKRTKWTPEMRDSVVKFYHETDPNKWNQTKRIKELWDRKYPNHSDIEGATLMMKVRDLLRNKGEEFNMKKKNFTKEEKIHLVRSFHESRKHKGEKTKTMRELFIKEYPQYAELGSQTLRKKVLLIRQNNPEIDEKILGRVSGFDKAHSSREPGETSGSKRVESTSVPTTQGDHFPGTSEIGETMFLGYHASRDFDTSHGIIYADVGSSHQSVPNHPEDVGTSQQTVHPENAWKQDTTLRLPMSDHVIHLKQRPPKKSPRKSTKGKEPVLD